MKDIYKLSKHYSKIGLLSILFAFASCSEEQILDLSPLNNIDETKAFTTPSLISLSVTGMYNAAGIGVYNGGGARGYVFGAAFIQQGDNRGEDVINLASFYQLTYTATYDPTTANNVYFWGDAYRLINRTNIVIEGVTKAAASGIITQSVADDYIGQAKFLRAITHFELLVHFARPYQDTPAATHLGVPYREIPNNTQANIDLNLAQGRNTVAECYAKILADLTDAETKMVSKSARSGTHNIDNATKEAAIAYKTKVYLQMGSWANVITEGVKLNSSYTMTTTPNGPFANNLANSESIFSIANDATNNPGINGSLPSMFNSFGAGGRGLIAISPIIWRDPTWLADDKRREEGVMITTGIVGAASNVGSKFTRKYKDPKTMSDAAPVIRYAEVALNMAEAYARQGDVVNGLANLNKVRNRSLANPTTQAYTAVSFANSIALLGAILKERRIEFLCEGHRWADISRLQGDTNFPVVGIPAKVKNGGFTTLAAATPAYTLGSPYIITASDLPAVPYSNFKFVWPLPALDLNYNPTLAAQQNPGY
jgi:hypothetical protein